MQTPPPAHLALFGGTFDPPHLGHTACASAALNTHELKKVIFIPTAQNPLKSHPTATWHHRTAMTKIAIRNNPAFELSLIEMQKDASAIANYTIDTVRLLKASYPTDKLYFIIGTEIIPSLHKWKEIETLVTFVEFIPVIRPGFNLKEVLLKSELSSQVKEVLIKNIVTDPMPEIASTPIRENIKKYANFLDKDVLEYINKNKLYQ